MKWLVVGVVVAAVLVAAALLPRKSVHAEIVINATPGFVWRAITDTSSYNDWNPIFQNLQGRFVEGQTVHFDMRVANGTFTPMEALVVELESQRKLHQRAGTPGILTADHQWLLETSIGGTRVIQHEEYRGIYVLFWNPEYVEVLYQQGLEALQARLEGGAS